jgi:anti-anti-sigma factor
LQRELNYSITDYEGIKVVNLTGNISRLNRKEFSVLVNRLTQFYNVIINMGNIGIVTTSGMDVLIDVCVEARKKKKRVMLLGVKDELKKMIETFDVFDYFILVESIEEGQMKMRYYL